MPLEIALTNVDVEAGQVAGGGDDAPWILGFRDTTTQVVCSVTFSADKLRETCEAILRALDGEKQKPKIALATSIPSKIA